MNPVDNTSPSVWVHATNSLLETYLNDNWWPAASSFELIVGAILVQNTRWLNVEKALDRLRDAEQLSADAISRLAVEELQELIRPAGCQSVKARRLQNVASWLCQHDSVAQLALMPTADLREALLAINGIGPETADVLLCFVFNRPVFIADAYARRFFQRLLGDAEQSTGPAAYAALQARAEKQLSGPAEFRQDLHAALVQHAQQTCVARPRCQSCVLQVRCNFARYAEGKAA